MPSILGVLPGSPLTVTTAKSVILQSSFRRDDGIRKGGLPSLIPLLERRSAVLPFPYSIYHWDRRWNRKPRRRDCVLFHQCFAFFSLQLTSSLLNRVLRLDNEILNANPFLNVVQGTSVSGRCQAASSGAVA
jgi:hypothetical protein